MVDARELLPELQLAFKLQDMWVGAYWERGRSEAKFTLYVCLLPCLPLRMRWGVNYYGVNGPFDRRRLEHIMRARGASGGPKSSVMYVCPKLYQEALREAQGLLEVVVKPGWEEGWYIA